MVSPFALGSDEGAMIAGMNEQFAANAITTGEAIGPDYNVAAPASQSLGRAAVTLRGPGQYVRFTVKAPANAIDVSYALRPGATAALNRAGGRRHPADNNVAQFARHVRHRRQQHQRQRAAALLRRAAAARTWVAASVDRTIIPPTAVVMPLAALFGLAFGFIRNEEIFKGAMALALEDES